MAKVQIAVIFGERFIRAMAALCSIAGPHTESLTDLRNAATIASSSVVGTVE